MGNMSYCRFQNTLNDLRDCFYNMYDEEVSPEEAKARFHLIGLCFAIADDYVCDGFPVYDIEGNFQG
jgi:hypothetical protein